MRGDGGGQQLTIFGTGSAEVRERIKRLRLVRRWDQEELAHKANVSTATISNIERGRVAPTADQIDDIAQAFGYTSAFLTAEMGLLPTTRPWLRAYADASKREADARTAAATLAAEYVRSLRLKPLPNLVPIWTRSIDGDDAIEDAAAETRHLAEIESGAVVTNVIRAAERLGCIVLPLESELGRHLGMSVRADDIPIMSVAKSGSGVPGDRQRWTVAHELGHLVLHGNAPPPRNAQEARRMEDQAHRFAGAFLCPEDALVETLGGRAVTLNTLVNMKFVWGVAVKALVHRCETVGIIEPEHARSLYKQISARKWTKKEPIHVPPESAQWFERTLQRKAEVEDLPTACKHLAAAIGANAVDLLSFADWSIGSDAKIVSLADRRRS